MSFLICQARIQCNIVMKNITVDENEDPRCRVSTFNCMQGHDIAIIIIILFYYMYVFITFVFFVLHHSFYTKITGQHFKTVFFLFVLPCVNIYLINT